MLSRNNIYLFVGYLLVVLELKITVNCCTNITTSNIFDFIQNSYITWTCYKPRFLYWCVSACNGLYMLIFENACCFLPTFSVAFDYRIYIHANTYDNCRLLLENKPYSCIRQGLIACLDQPMEKTSRKG